MHTCNAFCFGGVHAVFMDVEASELAHIEGAAKIIAAQNGLEPAGYTLVSPPQSAPAGTPTRFGVQRGRVIIWGRRD